jgi:hypothetical protein
VAPSSIGTPTGVDLLFKVTHKNLVFQQPDKIGNMKKFMTLALFLWAFFLNPTLGHSAEEGGKNVEGLIRKLKDKDPYVQKSASRRLGELKDPRAVEPLLDLVRETCDR